MDTDKLKVAIIDNNRDRREAIKNMLPDYAEGFVCDFGDSAFKAIKPDMDGRIPSLIIIDGDDESKRGIDLFDWVRNREPSVRKRFIPVLVLTEDEFSDYAMSFFEIGDVVFYEGELFENEFYSAFVEALDMLPPQNDEEESPKISETSPEKIMGKSVKAPIAPQDKPQRTIVLTQDERLANLALAIERGRAQVEEIRVIQAERDGKEYVRKYTSHDRLYGNTYIEEDNGEQAINTAGANAQVDEDDIPEEFRIRSRVEKEPDSSTAVRKATMQNNAPDTRTLTQEKGLVRESTPDVKRATIVVVDDHDFVRKMFEMTLSDKYNVVSVSSGMKAVDYFVKNTADVIFLDAVMPGLAGVQALNSIRWQKNGKTVPCVFLVGKDYEGPMSAFNGDYVCGTLPKPISKGAILTAVEQLKRFIRKM